MTIAPIRVGIGGWTFEPWRGAFYPPKLRQADELGYATAQLTGLEIEGTYYRLATPKSYAGWAKAAPDGFVYSVKASRYCTNRKLLGEAGEGIAKFIDSGLVELGDRLGPILWQFMATKRFDPDDFGAFLKLLPTSHKGLALRHAIEPRHESFADPAFTAMARAAGVATVIADSPERPQFADLTGPFVYARLQDAQEACPTGYDEAALDRWAETARAWAAGEQPEGLRYITDDAAPRTPRETFIFFINGAKVRAPAGASISAWLPSRRSVESQRGGLTMVFDGHWRSGRSTWGKGRYLVDGSRSMASLSCRRERSGQPLGAGRGAWPPRKRSARLRARKSKQQEAAIRH